MALSFLFILLVMFLCYNTLTFYTFLYFFQIGFLDGRNMVITIDNQTMMVLVNKTAQKFEGYILYQLHHLIWLQRLCGMTEIVQLQTISYVNGCNMTVRSFISNFVGLKIYYKPRFCWRSDCALNDEQIFARFARSALDHRLRQCKNKVYLF